MGAREAPGGLCRGAAALAGALLTAAAPAAELTRDNFVEVAETVVDMVETSGFAFSTLLVGQGPARAQAAAFGRGGGAIGSAFGALPQAGATRTPCPGGGAIGARVTDADTSGDLSVRDRFVTEFDACRIGDEVVSGRNEFVVAAHAVAGGVESTTLDFRFHALGTDAMRWNGPARVVLETDLKSGAERYAVTWSDFAVRRGARAYRLDARLEARLPPIGDFTVRIDGRMTLGALMLQLVQDEPFVVSPEGAPRRGRLQAGDARGNRLDIEGAQGRYAYALYRAGRTGDAPDASARSAPR